MVNAYAMTQVFCSMVEDVLGVFLDLSNPELTVFLALKTVFLVQMTNLVQNASMGLILTLWQTSAKKNRLSKIVAKTKYWGMANVYVMIQVYNLMEEYVLGVFLVLLNLETIVYLVSWIVFHAQMINLVNNVLKV